MPTTTFDNAAVGYDAVVLYEDIANESVIPIQIAPGFYPAAFTGLILTETATDAANGNKTLLAINDGIFFRNSDASPRNVTITSQIDSLGRLDDMTLTIPAGGIAFFGPIKFQGWTSPDGYVHYFSNSNLVLASPVSFRSS